MSHIAKYRLKIYALVLKANNIVALLKGRFGIAIFHLSQLKLIITDFKIYHFILLGVLINKGFGGVPEVLLRPESDNRWIEQNCKLKLAVKELQ